MSVFVRFLYGSGSGVGRRVLYFAPMGPAGPPGSGGSLTVREVDGSPTGTATVLEVPNTALSFPSAGVARLAVAPTDSPSFTGVVTAPQIDSPDGNAGFFLTDGQVLLRGTLDLNGNQAVGDGGGLTNLNASNLASGTVPVARLPVRFGLVLPSAQTFDLRIAVSFTLRSLSRGTATGTGSVTVSRNGSNVAGLVGLSASTTVATSAPSSPTAFAAGDLLTVAFTGSGTNLSLTFSE